MKTHTLGAGQFIEFIVPVKEMKHTRERNETYDHNNHMFHFNSVVKLNLSIRIISV